MTATSRSRYCSCRTCACRLRTRAPVTKPTIMANTRGVLEALISVPHRPSLDGVSLRCSYHGSKRGEGHYRHHKLAHFSLLLNFYGGATTLGPCTTSRRDEAGACLRRTAVVGRIFQQQRKISLGISRGPLWLRLECRGALCRQHVRSDRPMPNCLFDLYLKAIRIFPTPAAIKVRAPHSLGSNSGRAELRSLSSGLPQCAEGEAALDVGRG